jgi:branched-chain amino acid transport system substrate-binding protein
MPLITGQLLNNRYRIVKLLGQGGFGAVYRAWDVNLSGPCAIKENSETSPAAQNQFTREASILYNLRHPNLPKVTDHFSVQGQGQYLVMEYIEGQDLQEMIDQAGEPLTEAQVLPWIMQVCEALNYLHHRTPPIIHRDIKPANVRITPEGTVYLVDFGIAKLYDPERKTTLGARAVTPGYSPFEQYGQKSTDARTDVYALGATLYTALTGRLPLESIERVGGATLSPPRTLNPGISPPVEAAILRAMALMPEQRYQEIMQLKEALSTPTETQASVIPPLIFSAIPTQGIQATTPQPTSLTTTYGLPMRDISSTVAMEQVPVQARKGKKYPWLALGAVITVIVVLIAGLLMGYPTLKDYLPGLAPIKATIVPTNTSLATLPSTPREETVPSPVAFNCTDPLGCVAVPAGAPIEIGYALVMDGPNQSLGIDTLNGIEIAMKDRGQIAGHDIRLTGQNDGCSSEGGQAAGRALASNPNIVAVIGTSCSTAAQAANPILSEAGLLIVSPSSTAPYLTETGNPSHFPGFFRTAINDKFQGGSAAHFAREGLRIERAATIHDGSQYAEYLLAIFIAEFKRLGGVVTAQEVIDPNQTEVQPIIQRLVSGDPELIYLPILQPAGGRIIRQVRETPGLSGIHLMGADSLFQPELIEAAGNAVAGFLVTNPVVSGPAYDEFLVKYKDKFGKDPISVFHANAYDAAMLIFTAIEKAAIQTPDGTLYIPRQRLREAMYEIRDFPGVTGKLTCDPNGDCANPVIAVYEYHAGQYPPEKIWP